MSVEWIYGSGRRSSSLDRLTGAQTQILAIAARNDPEEGGISRVFNFASMTSVQQSAGIAVCVWHRPGKFDA